MRFNYETVLTASGKCGITGSIMARLNNRNRQIPFGLKFYQPETRFNANNAHSFNGLVDQVVAMRRANPALVAKHGWSVDWNVVADEVDAFNAAICERMGWTEFITSAAPTAPPPPSPKFKALSQVDEKQLSAVARKVKKVWQGVKTLNDWIESNKPAVPPEQSEMRANVCVSCPLNGSGGLEEWFTKPAAAAIKVQFSKLSERKLSTTVDDKLNVCSACLCPLKLKVHTPLEFISPHMSQEVRNALNPACWITAEETAKTSTAVDSK